MSHESTVEHPNLFDIPSNISLTEALSRLQSKKQNSNEVQSVPAKSTEKPVEEPKRKVERKNSKVPHPFPETPTTITHDADLDSDDQDSN